VGFTLFIRPQACALRVAAPTCLPGGNTSSVAACVPSVVAKVPVLGMYAGLDIFIKPEAIDRMTAGLRNAGSGSETIVFPNVNHGFNADYRPSYDKTAASYASKLALDWLRQHGVWCHARYGGLARIAPAGFKHGGLGRIIPPCIFLLPKCRVLATTSSCSTKPRADSA